MRTEGMPAVRMGPDASAVKARARWQNVAVLDVLFPLLIALAIVFGALTGSLAAVGASVTEGARSAVTIAAGLLATMTLWLGLVRVLEAGGALATVTRALRPIMRRLFPEVPVDH